MELEKTSKTIVNGLHDSIHGTHVYLGYILLNIVTRKPLLWSIDRPG